jgi:sulfite reductase alpha subunit-like flavoprotein
LETLSNGRLGQVSGYLNTMYQSVKDYQAERITARVFIKDSMFDLPADQAKTPLICVGPGTGVVPFIGFLQDREVHIAEG